MSINRQQRVVLDVSKVSMYYFKENEDQSFLGFCITQFWRHRKLIFKLETTTESNAIRIETTRILDLKYQLGDGLKPSCTWQWSETFVH